MTVDVTGKSAVYGIIGYPVTHSLSPVMQNAAFAACGLDGVYVPFEVTPENLARAVDGLRTLNIRGFNVTIPHKTTVMPFLDRLDESAESAGAVNVVLNDFGVLTGYNTDGDGLLKCLADDFGFNPDGSSVAVLGAGGAARGAVASFCRAGVKRVVIANRTPGKSGELASLMVQRYPDTTLVALDGFDAVERELSAVDLLVNTTSAGMSNGAETLVNIEGLGRAAIVYDMIYSPPVTQLLRDAGHLGLRNANGQGMLVSQGELAFMIWTGRIAPQGIMKRALSCIHRK